MSYLILVINFGSTSTKISVFENTAERLKVSVKHLPENWPYIGPWENRKNFVRKR